MNTPTQNAPASLQPMFVLLGAVGLTFLIHAWLFAWGYPQAEVARMEALAPPPATLTVSPK